MATRRDFTLPSLHDGTTLSCHIFHPQQLAHKFSGVAVLAHPYAPLGGNSSDPVVRLLAETFLHEGYIVGTFDFRGAGRSAGRTSWTARPEVNDYMTFAGFVIQYAKAFLGRNSERDTNSDASASVNIVFGGYSYGSLIARHIPDAQVICNRFENSSAGSPERDIMTKARELAMEAAGIEPDALSSARTPPSLTLRTSYLLISPLLWPVSTALTMQFTTLFSKDRGNLLYHRTLAVFGGNDIFTSSKRLARWARQMAEASSGNFTFEHVHEAGHFWHEPGVGRRLQDAVRAWLEQASAT